MTFDKLADRVLRVTKGLKAECLQYLYEGQNDFILKTLVTRKQDLEHVIPTTGTITAVADSATAGNAKYTVTSDTSTSGALIVGNKYTLTTFVAGDDFTNVASIVSGTVNVSGCVFIASETTPTTWTEGSTITKWTGVAVDDYVQIIDTGDYNGLQKVTVVTISTFTTDRAFVYAEANLTASYRYGFMFDLPSDYADYHSILWQGQPLSPITENEYECITDTNSYTLLSGVVIGFWMEGDSIRLVPAPDDTSALVINYAYFDTTAIPTSPIIKALYHQYLIDYAIAVMLEVAGDDAKANRHLTKYDDAVNIVLMNNASKYMS